MTAQQITIARRTLWACAKLSALGIPVVAAHSHTGRATVVAEIPAAITLYTPGVHLLRATSITRGHRT